MKKIFVIGLSGESIFLNVDHFHKLGETVHADSLKTECGGKGYNQAIALKKFGADVTYLSSIGKDIYGDKCEKYLIDNGVKPIMVKKDLPTALATILTDKNSENQVTVYSGATVALNKKDIEKVENEIKECDYLLLQLEVPLEANLKAVEIAKKHNVKIVINPAPAQNYTLELLQNADVITPNEEEAKTIFDLKDEPLEKILDKMDEYKIREVIVTIGKNGAMHFKNGNIEIIPSIKVEAIDTTGAGDTFNAMFVYQLSLGLDIKESIKWANVAAALSTTKRGVMDAIPNIDDIKKNF